MQKLLGKTILIEGADGAGKTTLANEIGNFFNINVYHSGGPETRAEILARANDIIANTEPAIFDRCPMVSEFVYGKVLRGKSCLRFSEVEEYWEKIKDRVIIIYCRPSFQTLQNHNLLEKPHKSKSHIEEVHQRLFDIYGKYGEVIEKMLFAGMHVRHYNRDTTDFHLFQKIMPEINNDLLKIIFAKQRMLMKKYHPVEDYNGLLLDKNIPVDINSALGQARLKDFAWRITEELAEAMNNLKNRPWKKTKTLTDIDAYEEELIDAFHFFIELFISSGINAERLTNIYLDKAIINEQRQRSNY